MREIYAGGGGLNATPRLVNRECRGGRLRNSFPADYRTRSGAVETTIHSFDFSEVAKSAGAEHHHSQNQADDDARAEADEAAPIAEGGCDEA
jgi:hypothetical protein